MSNNRTILILGSGATVGGKFHVNIDNVEYEPPMDKNFFESLPVQTIFNEDDYPALFYYQREMNKRSLEATWSKIDLILKLCLGKIINEGHAYERLKEKIEKKASSNDSYKKKLDNEKICSCVASMAGWEFFSLLKKVYGQIEPPKEESPLKKLISKLHEIDLLGSIITYNYDLSVESIFEDRFYYPIPDCTDTFEPKHKDANKIPLIKLHGSLNWQEDSKRGKISEVEGVAELKHKEMCYAQPSVIPPTIFKQEINIDFQWDWRAQFYKRLWNHCWNHGILNADNLMFIGFGFPSTDMHTRILFESASRKRNGFKTIVLCHKGNNMDAFHVAKSLVRDKGRVVAFTNGLDELVEKIDGVLRLINE